MNEDNSSGLVIRIGGAMRDIHINDWTKLGSTIRAERKRAHMSQHDLARRSGTSRSWIARIEAGHRGAEFEQILRLLEALDLTMILRRETTGATEGAGSRAQPQESEPQRESKVEAALTQILEQHVAQTDARRSAWDAAGQLQPDIIWDGGAIEIETSGQAADDESND